MLRSTNIIPRRLLLSAKMNLNKFWTELEELYLGRTSSKLLLLPELQDAEVEEQNRLNEEKEQLQNNFKI